MEVALTRVPLKVVLLGNSVLVCSKDQKNIGEFAEFLTQYLGQVESDWEGYMSSLENLIKYYFARDLLNYARLMPVHLAQMNALEEDDPETWNALESAFAISSPIRFSSRR